LIETTSGDAIAGGWRGSIIHTATLRPAHPGDSAAQDAIRNQSRPKLAELPDVVILSADF
jgi:hypothetical protein